MAVFIWACHAGKESALTLAGEKVRRGGLRRISPSTALRVVRLKPSCVFSSLTDARRWKLPNSNVAASSPKMVKGDFMSV